MMSTTTKPRGPAAPAGGGVEAPAAQEPLPEGLYVLDPWAAAAKHMGDGGTLEARAGRAAAQRQTPAPPPPAPLPVSTPPRTSPSPLLKPCTPRPPPARRW